MRHTGFGSSRLEGSGGTLPPGQDTRSYVPVEESVERGCRRAGKSRMPPYFPAWSRGPFCWTSDRLLESHQAVYRGAYQRV
jgi:hypothetical protein